MSQPTPPPIQQRRSPQIHRRPTSAWKKHLPIYLAVASALSFGLLAFGLMILFSGPSKEAGNETKGENTREKMREAFAEMRESNRDGATSTTDTSNIIAEFDGNGPGETKVFSVGDDWEWEWESRDEYATRMVYLCESDGTRLRLSLHDNPDREVWRFSNHIATGGEYKFEIVYQYGGSGPWKITVRQLSNRID